MLGLPFLLQHPASYTSKAFEFSRVFLLKWSVNWSCLPEDLFLSKSFALALLTVHLALLLAFAHYKWCKGVGGLPQLIWQRLQGSGVLVGPTQGNSVLQASTGKRVLVIVFTGNFIGILCARTLHFQFYSWYFHTLPLLLWHAKLSTPLRVVLLACIEVCWNVFPSSFASSSILLLCHCILLLGLWQTPDYLWLAQHVKSN